MRLERVFKSDELELSLTTLDDNHKPYQPFTFKINGIHKFNFYDRDNKPVSADCIFRGGALLEFSRVKDCSGLMKPDTHLGENARQKEVSDDQTTPYLFR